MVIVSTVPGETKNLTEAPSLHAPLDTCPAGGCDDDNESFSMFDLFKTQGKIGLEYS